MFSYKLHLFFLIVLKNVILIGIIWLGNRFQLLSYFCLFMFLLSYLIGCDIFLSLFRLSFSLTFLLYCSLPKFMDYYFICLPFDVIFLEITVNLWCNRVLERIGIGGSTTGLSSYTNSKYVFVFYFMAPYKEFN
jgi:hypothetical protein